MYYKVYEVYVAKDLSGKPLYVGNGKQGRHKHCNSGVSHCYELNEHHHLGKQMEVTVLIDRLSKEESIELEYNIIKTLEPAFNKKLSNGSSCTDKWLDEGNDVDFNDVSAVTKFITFNTDDTDTMRLILHYTVVPEITYIVSRVLDQKIY